MLNVYTALTAFVATAQDRLGKDEKGATAVEYGLMVGLIAVVIIVAVTALGDQLGSLFDGVTDELEKVPAGGTGTGTATTP